MSAPTGPSPAAAGLQFTKDNIRSFSYYQLFSLPDPVRDSGSTTTDAITAGIDAVALTRAYRRFSLHFHPDKDPSPEAREAFEYIKAALDTLVDETKRAEYDAHCRSETSCGSGSGGADADQQWRQQQQRQAEDEADFAGHILRQREAGHAAAAAARALAAEERGAATRRMQEELTSSLDTPFRMMESQVIKDWDVDEGLLAMKLAEVERLMGDLAEATGEDGGGAATPQANKRHKSEG